MIDALKKYELQNVLLTQILSSNPHAAKSGRISTEMDSRTVPFEEYQKAQINQGLSLFSSKEIMELNMAALLTARGDALTELFSGIEEDENIVDKIPAKLALLDETIYYDDLLMKIELLASNGNYAAARQLTTDATNYFRLMPEDKVDMESMYDLLEIQEALFAWPDATLNNAQETTLYEMLDKTSAVVNTKALAILIEQGVYNYFEPITIDENELKSKDLTYWSTDKHYYKVYPNPAHDLLTIEYKHAGVFSIELYDLTGKLILKQGTQNLAIQFVLNIAELPISLYEVRLTNQYGATLASSVLLKQ
jgi:Secretion system C-terminal sorting domain